SKIENCQTVDEITHPAVREILRYLKIDRGLEIHHDGDLPARSGMGSSSSFTVGLLHALYALKGVMPNKRQLALESIHVEQECLHEVVGSQDQVMAAYGGLNHDLPSEWWDLGPAGHNLASARPGADLPPDALLHRDQAHGFRHRRELRERRRR